MSVPSHQARNALETEFEYCGECGSPELPAVATVRAALVEAANDSTDPIGALVSLLWPAELAYRATANRRCCCAKSKGEL